MVPIDQLKPNPRNPNKHPKDQIEELAEIIRVTGWRRPIIVSNQSGLVVVGHGRLSAGYLLEAKEVPVDFQDYDTPDHETADMIGDNAIALKAEIDLAETFSLLKELPAELIPLTACDPDAILEELRGDAHEGGEKSFGPEDGGPVPYFVSPDQAVTIGKAIKKIRREEKPDMSDGRALELICAEFIS